jgi:hypothetical protein
MMTDICSLLGPSCDVATDEAPVSQWCKNNLSLREARPRVQAGAIPRSYRTTTEALGGLVPLRL